MTKIILTTESGADFPEDWAKQYNVHTVPMHIIMDGKDYLDGFLPVQDIFDFYDRTKKIPSTTSTNEHEYDAFFKKINEDNPGCTIVHIGYTSKASSSFQHAVLASKEFDNIFLIDALNVTGGLTAVVKYAVDLLEEDPEIESEKLVEKITAIVPKSRLSFTPGSLEFLRAGGRVSNLAFLSGALLKIKPRIELIEGKLLSNKKYRGDIASVVEKLMYDYFKQYDIDPKQLYLQYSIGLDDRVKQRAEEIAKEHGFENIKWMEVGAMISTHAGPGGFGVAGLEK